jgi:HD-like signal output (HDOD) protein/DNA-directed RNA polymerase subunit RPC12/RpoP
MNFSCSNCYKTYTITDGKLPATKKLAFPCPDCGHRIELNLCDNTSGDTVSLEKTGVAAAPASAPTDEKQTAEELKKRILSNLSGLPPMPQIVFKAHEIMEDPNSGTKKVAELIETDQAIAAKVLKMANSAYYGMSGKVSSIQHAAVVLGDKALGELVTLAGTSSLLSNKLYGYAMDSGELWRHSMTVAFGSKIMAQRYMPQLENDAFSVGLIHDVGKLVLDRPVLNRKSVFDEFMDSGDKTFLSAENRILGFDHAEIGYDICQQWQIPDSLAKAIRYHHRPSAASDDSLVCIVSMADTIANMAAAMSMAGRIQSGIDAVMYMVDDTVMERLALGEKDIGVIMESALDAVEKIMLEIDPT